MKRISLPVQVAVSVTALMASVFWTSWLLENSTIAAGPRLALVLVTPAIAVWTFTVYVRLVRSIDEFHRKVLLESLAIGFPIALLMGMLVEYLQKGGFALGIDVGRLWPAQGIVWALALLYARRRYR